MIITTESQYAEMFKKRSRILNCPAPDQRQMPRYFSSMGLTLRGIEAMLVERREMLTDAQGQVRFARREWENFRERQLMPRSAQPISHFADRINHYRGKVLCYEAELRELNRLRQEHLEKQLAENEARHCHPIGHAKMKDGRLASVDGRAVVTGIDGEAVFEDTGEKVVAYLEALRQEKRARVIAKRAGQRALAERIRAARTSEPLPNG